MASYAILGATGQTGSHILQLLLRDHPSAEINVLVRSRTKLEALLDSPSSYSSSSLSGSTYDDVASRVHIYEGTITDVPVVTACLRGVKTAFLTVATLYNVPRTRVAQDQAEAVVAALEDLRRQQQGGESSDGVVDTMNRDSSKGKHGDRNTTTKVVAQKDASLLSERPPTTNTMKDEKINDNNSNKNDLRLPLLVMISSAETQIDPFCLAIPGPVRDFLFCCNYWIYTDLMAAEAYLRRRGAGWLDVVFFKPGGIAHDVQRGHVLSTRESQTFVSFWDVAAAMIECGSEENREALAGKSVSVLSRGKARLPLGTPLVLLKNLTGYLFPRLYEWLF